MLIKLFDEMVVYVSCYLATPSLFNLHGSIFFITTNNALLELLYMSTFLSESLFLPGPKSMNVFKALDLY